MATVNELRKPRPKKGSGNTPRDAPFPVPIASLTGKPATQERWYYYFGLLKGDSVIIDRLGDMTFLYKMGFFGKGTMSQSSPQFNKYGNTFDERCRSRILGGKKKMLSKEEREQRESYFDDIHLERLRQHQEWSLQKKSMAQEELPKKQVKLEDPYQVDEFLQLSLEEAFFLTFGLGCLTVTTEDKKQLSICEMWIKFCQLNKRFLETYATYHYFRSLGWVVRDGVVYGSDFLLYKDGMPFYHSSYSVFSYLVEDGKVGKTTESLPWTWPYLTCVNRVAERVAKEVLISFVIKPKGLTEEELSSPRCLAKFEVQEILLRRWIPEKHRESKKGS